MRIVRWSPQERVDTPDITAMSFLTLGEFRRTFRGAMLGSAIATPNYILNGFAVEPQAVPDATIRVRLDVSGLLSFAIGAELVGSRVDYGQLIGGDDSNGNTEGNATQTVDFTGQPNATYTVQMRHTFADGVSDNRAFWNPGSNTEFIAAVDTRHLPQFELNYDQVGNEWIDLADVVWNSGVGTISSGDITDLRDFAVEGVTPWTQTTKLGAGSIPDFSRSTDRAANGLNAVFPALRGLARQIQDIKGADDGGNWNWWNDPYLPADPSSTLTRDQTTSLRSLRTVHFTVGDGVTTFGDFNGTALASGLDACLSHIETEDAVDMHGHYIVQILANGDDNSNTQWQISNYDFSSCMVEIRGGGGSSTTFGEKEWCSAILCAGTLTTEAFDLTGNGSGLVLRNLRFVDTGSDTEIVRLDTQTHFEMHGCLIEVASTAGNPWLEMGSVYNGYITNSTMLNGVALIDGNASGKVMWEGCKFTNGSVRFASAGNPAGDHIFNGCNFANNSDVDNCVFISGAFDIAFNDCKFSNSSMDYDIVHADTSLGDWGQLRFQGCYFSSFETTPNRLPDAGTNSTLGTGWQIFLDNSANTDDDSGRGVSIDHCFFTASGDAGSGVIDSGGVYAEEVSNLTITNCEFFDFDTLTGGTPRCYLVHIQGTAIGDAESISITNCDFGSWASGSTTHQCLRMEDQQGSRIANNSFDQLGQGNGLYIENCDYSTITGNHFENGGTTSDMVNLINGTGTAVTGNTFWQCARSISCIASTSSTFVGNTSNGDNGTAPTLGVFVTSSANCVFSGNSIFNFSGAYDAIYITANNQTIFANNSTDGDINLNGTTGHAGGATDNVVNAFTP